MKKFILLLIVAVGLSYYVGSHSKVHNTSYKSNKKTFSNYKPLIPEKKFKVPKIKKR